MSTPTTGLSTALDTDTYRARPSDDIRWSKAAGSAPCDECVALQHETRGAHRREPARRRRAVVGGPSLLLCQRHADTWGARDDHDLAR